MPQSGYNQTNRQNNQNPQGSTRKNGSDFDPMVGGFNNGKQGQGIRKGDMRGSAYNGNGPQQQNSNNGQMNSNQLNFSSTNGFNANDPYRSNNNNNRGSNSNALNMQL